MDTSKLTKGQLKKLKEKQKKEAAAKAAAEGGVRWDRLLIGPEPV